MFKKLRQRNLHIAVIFFLTGLFIGLNASFVSFAKEQTFKYLDYFHFVYQTVRSDYVEDADSKNIFAGAIKGMLESLNDPYTRYLNEEDYAEFKEAVTGQFVGIGVEISIKDGDVVVIAPIADTPAFKAGIQPGDIIVKIDDTPVRDKNLNQVIQKIKGMPESKISLLIKRDAFPELIKYEIERAAIKVGSIKYGTINEADGIGYLKITHFFGDTATDVEKAIKELNQKKTGKLILDLRDNPGGNMEAAISIANFFLDKGKVIVSTRGREGSGIGEEYKSESDPIYKGKLLVLVNGGSASASEILSGALRDNERARLLGQKTFGKALVQRVVDIEPNKTGFTLTIRKYYTPSGALINKKGITPDIALPAMEVPENDRKNLGRILNDNVIDEFVKKNGEYTPENRAKLAVYLKEKNLPVSERVANFYLKSTINRYKQTPLYDLEFDTELNKAIEVIK